MSGRSAGHEAPIRHRRRFGYVGLFDYLDCEFGACPDGPSDNYFIARFDLKSFAFNVSIIIQDENCWSNSCASCVTNAFSAVDNGLHYTLLLMYDDMNS